MASASSSSAAPSCAASRGARRQLFGDAALRKATFGVTARDAGGGAATRRRGASSTTVAFGNSSGGAAGHAHSSWGGSHKHLVEVLATGSGLARAPCAWYVDHSLPSSPSSSGGSGDGSPQRGISGGGSGGAPGGSVLRVNARQVGVSHAALAHADSSECHQLRGDLERHVRGGGATVFVTPIIDPVILSMFGGGSSGGSGGGGGGE
eukprot:CAMPEP_0197583708 /NCGR_PEP_ID=MMETSP1326-20131121/6538_1 /TAXON_ID=1155430 /ORGANISM="Genus nov. species nov., Strain RCC2288" /LENGTH=206 /DNA_ID=CAMNT_0043147965 /DNA_START=201 /DNA_END=818 /DNA_ORIENTATION=+